MPALPDTNLTRSLAEHRSRTLQIQRQSVELDLTDAADPDATTFGTVSTIGLTSTDPRVLLDFIGAGVEEVLVDGQPWPFAYDGVHVELADLPTGRPIQVAVTARGTYSRTGQGLHRYLDPADGATYLYTHSETTDARRFIVCVDQPDLKAEFSVVVTAPREWLVLSNQPETEGAALPQAPDAAAEETATHVFAATPPLSTYLMCLAAGPYRRWEDSWTDGVTTIELGVLCRQSIAEAMDAQAVLDLTKAGLTFFHDLFEFPYPWGKYDSVFVPEYNLGAMENPGLVTFNDAYVFQSAATAHQYEARASTVMHEMAHMWFGDLVTPPWWSDLWLKESFADYMGNLATAEATEFTDAWTAFSLGRKGRGSADDQRPTTHPIVADIPDIEAARQNFDGITYSKGAAVVQQLVAYVGREAFAQATRAFFREHAFGCATLEDLLAALHAASGRDLQTWATAWLQSAGISTITAQVDAPAGTIERLRLTQSGVDPTTGEEILRPHRVAVGCYALEDGSLRRTHRFEVDLIEEDVDIPEAVGIEVPDLLLLNDDDLTYATVRLDDVSTRAALTGVSTIPTSLSRAVVWAALWDACRDGLLPAADYIDAALSQIGDEPDPAIQALALRRAVFAATQFTAGADRAATWRRLLDGAWTHLLQAAPGSDAQLTWARTVASAAALDDAHADDLRAILRGDRVIEGLPLGPELTWSWWTALAATGHVDAHELAAVRAQDTTSLAPIRLERALASRPDAQVKAQVWQTLLTEVDASNDLVTARVTGWAQPGQEAVRPDRLTDYLEALEPVWRSRSQEIAERILEVAFPSEVDLADAPEGRPRVHPVVLACTRWLEEHPDAPRALRAVVIEGVDDALRALHAQACRPESAEPLE